MAREHHSGVGPLSDLNDFTVADDNPDVRGWDVISADGRKIGEVEDLIVDTNAMRVRYLDVEVDKDFRADNDHRILIPIGQAQLHEKEDHVHVNTLRSTEVRAIPRYSGEWNRNDEDAARRHFGTPTDSGSDNYYSHSHYDDSSFFGSRRNQRDDRGGSEKRMTLSEEHLDVHKERSSAGEMRVGKHVETEHVSRDVPVEREVATVERRRIDPDDKRHASPRIGEDEIRIPLSEEELSVQKRAVPREELVVRKERVRDTEHVEADLKKERADVRQNDDRTRRNRG